jgi:hypothetical protein
MQSRRDARIKAVDLAPSARNTSLRSQSMFRFDEIKTVLQLFVLSHVVMQNRLPLLRNMLQA